MKGLAKGLDINGSGIVQYGVLDNNNTMVYLTSRAYYVPTATRRIFSPQAYLLVGSIVPSVAEAKTALVLNVPKIKTRQNSRKKDFFGDIKYFKKQKLSKN